MLQSHSCKLFKSTEVLMQNKLHLSKPWIRAFIWLMKKHSISHSVSWLFPSPCHSFNAHNFSSAICIYLHYEFGKILIDATAQICGRGEKQACSWECGALDIRGLLAALKTAEIRVLYNFFGSYWHTGESNLSTVFLSCFTLYNFVLQKHLSWTDTVLFRGFESSSVT